MTSIYTLDRLGELAHRYVFCSDELEKQERGVTLGT